MKFWQMVPWMETEQLAEVAKFAEEVGFEGVMNADHAVYPEVVNAPYPYSPTGKPLMKRFSKLLSIVIARIALETSRRA